MPALVQAVVARGARPAATPAAAAREAEVVFSSIPDDGALRTVALSQSGVLAGASPGTVYVDTSTVSAAVSAEVAAAAIAKGVHYLRVTVSGNNRMAESKALTVMASGEREVYEKCRPLLKAKSNDLKKRDFSPTFTCLQARKDLGLIAGAAAASRAGRLRRDDQDGRA